MYSFEYVCFSSMGNCVVTPKALPLGIIVTLCMGSAPEVKEATRAN